MAFISQKVNIRIPTFSKDSYIPVNHYSGQLRPGSHWFTISLCDYANHAYFGSVKGG